MHLFYLWLRSFCLLYVIFTYSGRTVSKQDQTLFPDRGNREEKRPNRFSTASKKDQTDVPWYAKNIKPIYRKQQRPDISKKDLTVSTKDLPIFYPPMTRDFPHTTQGKWPFSGQSIQNGHFPCTSQQRGGRGGENRGSLVSVP